MNHANGKFGKATRSIGVVILSVLIVLAGVLVPRLWLASKWEPIEATAATEPAGVDSAWKPWIERALIAVALVGLAVGIGVAWFRAGRGRSTDSPPDLLRATAGLNLPFGCRLVLFRIEGRPFLGGVDPTGIKSFIPLPAPPDRTDSAEPNGATGVSSVTLEVRA